MLAGYIGRRIAQAALVLWLAATLAFLAMELAPGDPAQTLLAASGASAEEIAARRAQMGLDDPLPQRYLRYTYDLLRGNLGNSWLHGRPVAQMIWEQLPPTLELALSAILIGATLGLGLGIVAAARRGSWLDRLATTLAVIGLSTPTYWTGLLAILVFSLALRWLPATGAGDLRHLLLPAGVLGFAISGSVARMVRARMVELIQAPFVLAARARGLPARRVVVGHVLRAALPGILHVIALQLGFLLGGAVITESVFARPGLGRLSVEAIVWQDLPVVRGVVLFGALSYVLVNLVADLAQAWLDPRLRETLT